MTTLEKLEKLKAQVKSYAKLDNEVIWNNAQEWKRMVKVVMRTIFNEYVGCRSFEDRVDRLFNPSPIASEGTTSLPLISVKEIARKFQEDIVSAVGIMDECITTLKRLYEGYNPQRDSFQDADDVHEQLSAECRKNHASVIKEVDGSVVANRPTLSRASSKALDDAMDAEDDRFKETKHW